MKQVRYIVIPLEQYHKMEEELRILRQNRNGGFPAIEDIVFLSPRLYGHLNRQGIKLVSDLENTETTDWLRLPGFGKKSWEELKGLMKLYGLTFANER